MERVPEALPAQPAARSGVVERLPADEAPSDAKTGLSSEEATRRLAQYGENMLQEERPSALMKVLSFFWGPIPWMIETALVLSAIDREWADFSIILVMLVLNAAVGFWQEFKADNAIELLKQRLALKATPALPGAP